MKRTIVKFSAAALLMGAFALMPACKQKPAEDATATVATDSTVSAPAATDSMSAPAATDTSGAK